MVSFEGKFNIPDCKYGEVESLEKNGEYTVTRVSPITNDEHLEYLETLKGDGFKETENLFYGGSPFRTFLRNEEAVFVSYYPQWKAMYVKQSGKMACYNTPFEIPEVDFGIVEFAEKENDDSSVVSVIHTSENDFNDYTKKIESMGYEVAQSRTYGGSTFIALKKDGNAVYLSYYPAVSEMRIVAEKNSAYLTFNDTTRAKKVDSLVTQINLSDFGISEIVRLSDGRFIIFDGGWHYERDVDKLMKCLNEQKGDDEKPIIAAWFLTHAHCDHFWCFARFYEKYKDAVVIEKVLYNFCSPNDYFEKMYPGSFWKSKRWEISDREYMVKIADYIKDGNIDVYCPHTGQSFMIGNALCEILSCPDDVARTPVAEGNSLSLITKMTIEGQVIMWFGDGYFDTGKLVERYGSYLKADILQIPHHGFTGGTVKGYDAVDPDVCLATCFDDDCFTRNIHRVENYHLCCELNVKEFFAGKRFTEEELTLKLPYYPNPNGKRHLEKMVEDGLGSLGSRIWYFNDIVVNEGEDCIFTLLNTVWPADVYMTIYYEDGKTHNRLRYSVSGMRRINVAKLDESDDNPVQEFANNYPEKTLRTGVRFCLKFESRKPVVISSEGRTAAYNY